MCRWGANYTDLYRENKLFLWECTELDLLNIDLPRRKEALATASSLCVIYKKWMELGHVLGLGCHSSYRVNQWINYLINVRQKQQYFTTSHLKWQNTDMLSSLEQKKTKIPRHISQLITPQLLPDAALYLQKTDTLCSLTMFPAH